MIAGTVTRATGSVLAPATNLGNPVNAAAYVARNAAGTSLGFFPSAAEAQNAVRVFANNNLPLRWAREDMLGDIENWVGRNNVLDPLEIWAESLLLWAEMDAGVFLNPSTSDVRKVGNRAANGNNYLQTVAVDQPDLLSGVSGRPALSFDAAATEFMTANLVTDTEFTVMVLASLAVPGITRNLVTITGFGAAWALGVNGAGRWIFTNPTGITGPTTVGAAELVAVEQDAAGAELFVDGVSEGTNATAMAGTSATTVVSDAGAPTWSGLVTAIVITDEVAPMRRRQTEKYFSGKYGVPA